MTKRFQCQLHGGVDQPVQLTSFRLDFRLEFPELFDALRGFGEALQFLFMFFVGDHGRVFQ